MWMVWSSGTKKKKKQYIAVELEQRLHKMEMCDHKHFIMEPEDDDDGDRFFFFHQFIPKYLC